MFTRGLSSRDDLRLADRRWNAQKSDSESVESASSRVQAARTTCRRQTQPPVASREDTTRRAPEEPDESAPPLPRAPDRSLTRGVASKLVSERDAARDGGSEPSPCVSAVSSGRIAKGEKASHAKLLSLSLSLSLSTLCAGLVAARARRGPAPAAQCRDSQHS